MMQFIETAVVGAGVSMTSSTAVQLKTHRAAHPTSSVAIVGPGLVGVTTAYALLLSGVAPEIVLIGRDKARAEGNVHDLMDAALYSHPTRILCGDFSDCATADVVVVAVGVPQQGMKSRLDDMRESAASIAGMPLRDFCHKRSLAYEETALADIAMSARTAGLDIVRNKGATNYGIAAALTRVISAILRDEHAVLTVSSLAPQELQLGSVCLSLPAIVSREGICGHLLLRMDDAESEALYRSAGILKRHLATLNLPP
jgi:malate/lactate dehydrogenase